MKDFFGNDIRVSDTVALIPNGYRSLVEGNVTSLTPKQVRIEYFNTWNFDRKVAEETIRYPDTVIKKIIKDDTIRAN